MANTFAKKIDIFFDEMCVGFDAMNITSKNCAKYRAEAGTLQQSGGAFWRPVPYMLNTADGRDMSSSYQDIKELVVPTYLNEAHFRNVPVSFVGVDLNSPHAIERAAKAAALKLSNKVDTLVADVIATYGTLAVVNSGSIDTYDDAAEADALMLEQQATGGMRKMLLNPRMAKNILGNLASRQTDNRRDMTAYEKSMLPNIAGFDTFRTDYGKTIAGWSGTGYLINGASQSYTPLSYDGNGVPVDNRTQTITVDTGTNIANGAVFTIPNVYSVGHVNKQSTGQLKTFRLISGAGTGSWVISPPIIPADGTAVQQQYANVTTTPADNAAITVLNTTTKPCSVFFEESAVEIVHSNFDVSTFRDTGKMVRHATTDTGIDIVMMADSNTDTLTTKYRTFIWANPQVLNPEMCGVMLENQA